MQPSSEGINLGRDRLLGRDVKDGRRARVLDVLSAGN